MNNHQKEQSFSIQKEKMKQKYKANIDSFCRYHNVDLSVGWDMLFFNAKCFAKGINKDIIKGGGAVNVPALVKDYNELAKYIVYPGN